ncbi:MAG: dTDP-4-dehydrorhamnose reductase [Flavobacteria bacterium RIFCSPLOWO2_12_FULL_35_11]|nr:MAG: dTDP-4-dehydrorhamnose reductase [Flavobacteria bacterium RIFCSPLOWO2_12_FULL_35_11]
MNILITGSKGQLGLELENLGHQFPDLNLFCTDKFSLNILNLEEAEQYVLKNKIDVVVNCAAYTDVNKAEEEFKMADEVNHLAVRNLGLIAKRHNIKLIHISTDYVFDGNSSIPYKETDATNPQNAYGVSKLNGEKALLEINPKNSMIIRTSWLYSEFGNNFVKSMLKLSKEKESITVVSDQIGSPTYAKDLALTILQIIPEINSDDLQIYHYANKGQCSWFDFASAIMKISQQNCEVLPIPSSAFKTKAKRPKYSLLNTDKIQHTFNLEIPNWEDALRECILKG